MTNRASWPILRSRRDAGGSLRELSPRKGPEYNTAITLVCTLVCVVDPAADLRRGFPLG